MYLKAYDSVCAARQGPTVYIDFYNSRRPHQSHDGHTPDMIHLATLRPLAEAACGLNPEYRSQPGGLWRPQQEADR
jgi:hypothetical protein